VSENAKINKEEIFGPVLVLHRFKEENEVVARANDTGRSTFSGSFLTGLIACLAKNMGSTRQSIRKILTEQ
jgi:acyl-CoA reductase-like NAD-dependent aldehyde dehydrogenase